MTDIRLRFYYELASGDKILFKGYILHEDAWKLQSKFNNYSASYINKVKKETDKHFLDFIKKL